MSAAGAESRPSVLLVVLDTLRADAVSAYGAVEETTPELDALAADGALYRNAYAPAPWTLPSHATLLSGADLGEHRVGLQGRGALPDAVVTLAERLRDAGYETAGFSENGIVSDLFQLLQGFETRVASRVDGEGGYHPIDAAAEVESWLAKRDAAAPLFVFVNLMDPHTPYAVRAENRFVPDGVPRAEVVRRTTRPHRLLCRGLPSRAEREILRGLYLGDVRAGDAKLGRIVRALRAAVGGRPLLVVATSDHGEYFGEDRLMGHEFGLHDAVLKVPLIVHGRSPGGAEVRETPVSLADVAPSILRWTGVGGGEELAGRTLATGSEPAGSERPILAAFSDEKYWMPELLRRKSPLADRDANRQFCTESDRVWGGMATLIRYPFKLRWFERYPAQLYDLSWDRAEKSDQAARRPELLGELTRELAPFLAATGLAGGDADAPEAISDEAAEALRALGYVE